MKPAIRPTHQTIRSQLRSDHHIWIPQQTIVTTWPPNQTIRYYPHRSSRPPVQITLPDHRTASLTAQLAISTAYPASWNGTGQVHSLWVGSRGVYRALDEPCKAYFPHTFGLKFSDFFPLYLIVVRLASGVPGLVRASPSLSHRMGSFAGVRSAIRFRLLAIGLAFLIRFGF